MVRLNETARRLIISMDYRYEVVAVSRLVAALISWSPMIGSSDNTL